MQRSQHININKDLPVSLARLIWKVFPVSVWVVQMQVLQGKDFVDGKVFHPDRVDPLQPGRELFGRDLRQGLYDPVVVLFKPDEELPGETFPAMDFFFLQVGLTSQ
jgi:hypothetical protein